MAGPSKRARFLEHLAVPEQDIVDENYADADSDEEQNDTRLQDPDDNNDNYDSNDNNEDADWLGKLPALQIGPQCIHLLDNKMDSTKKLHQI
jgi:hypothetical protein